MIIWHDSSGQCLGVWDQWVTMEITKIKTSRQNQNISNGQKNSYKRNGRKNDQLLNIFFYNTINKRMLAWCKTAVSPLAVCLCTVSHPKNQNVLPLHFINGILSEWIDVAEPYVEFVWGWKLQVTVWYSWLISTSEMDMIQQIEQTLGQQEFNFVSTKP